MLLCAGSVPVLRVVSFNGPLGTWSKNHSLVHTGRQNAPRSLAVCVHMQERHDLANYIIIMKSARRLVQMKTCQPDVCRFLNGTTMSFLHTRVTAASVRVCLRECDMTTTALLQQSPRAPPMARSSLALNLLIFSAIVVLQADSSTCWRRQCPGSLEGLE